jgi:small subunit ribosomal protein S20
MPVTYSSKRALRKSLRKAEVNRRVRNQMKSVIKDAKSSKNVEALPKAYQAIDRAAKTHIIHKNKAARLKSQLAKLFTKLKSAPAKTAKSA